MFKCLSIISETYVLKARTCYLVVVLDESEAKLIPADSELKAIIKTARFRVNSYFHFSDGTLVAINPCILGVGSSEQEAKEDSNIYQDEIEIWKKVIDHKLIPDVDTVTFAPAYEEYVQYRKQYKQIEEEQDSANSKFVDQKRVLTKKYKNNRAQVFEDIPVEFVK